MPGRDRLALLASFAAPLALAAILMPWRASFPNPDAALSLVVVVAVAADGYRPAGFAAAVSAAVWGRRQHAVASRRAGYLDGISAAVQAVATGGSPSDLIDQVSRQLTRLLSLQSCHFQYGVAGLGQPARRHHDGTVTAGRQPWDVSSAGFPRGGDLELLVENGGFLQGRFLMTPGPGARPSLEQRLLAAAFADQAAAALAAGHPVEQ